MTLRPIKLAVPHWNQGTATLPGSWGRCSHKGSQVVCSNEINKINKRSYNFQLYIFYYIDHNATIYSQRKTCFAADESRWKKQGTPLPVRAILNGTASSQAASSIGAWPAFGTIADLDLGNICAKASMSDAETIPSASPGNPFLLIPNDESPISTMSTMSLP